jgi:pSer/pThr/pTyr-binding forkhead associated (FHA) protein
VKIPSPLELQFLFLGLLWLLVILLAGGLMAHGRQRKVAKPPSPAGGPITAPTAAPVSNAAPELWIEFPPVDGTGARTERVVLQSPRVMLGRSSEASIPLQDEFASSRHAVLIRDPEGLKLEDLGSRNGTLLNDRPVTGVVAVSDGDVIRIGRTLIRVKL